MTGSRNTAGISRRLEPPNAHLALARIALACLTPALPAAARSACDWTLVFDTHHVDAKSDTCRLADSTRHIAAVDLRQHPSDDRPRIPNARPRRNRNACRHAVQSRSRHHWPRPDRKHAVAAPDADPAIPLRDPCVLRTVLRRGPTTRRFLKKKDVLPTRELEARTQLFRGYWHCTPASTCG